MRTADFFTFARTRHEIYLSRDAGEPPPWTSDPILSSFRFTNVFRELDRTTVWFRENVREPLRNDKRVLLATIAFRWFNRIETGERLFGLATDLHTTNLFLDWNTEYARRRLEGRNPVVTAAYIIKTPDGKNKLDGVLWCIDQCRDGIDRLYSEMTGRSLEDAWRTLCAMPYMGPFMAYEVVSDLRHTHMLENARDINSWANPGPGCRRGLSRLVGQDKDHYRTGKNAEIQKMMKTLLHASKFAQHWPKEWPTWEMREVEHTLCEFDKYERARSGEGRPKQRFTSDPS